MRWLPSLMNWNGPRCWTAIAGDEQHPGLTLDPGGTQPISGGPAGVLFTRIQDRMER